MLTTPIDILDMNRNFDPLKSCNYLLVHNA